MAVDVFHPGVSVRLVKAVRRAVVATGVSASADRYQSFTGLDLTPWLDEHGGVSVTKSVRDIVGSFSLGLIDAPHPQFMESIYALIEPMDMIEIRMARQPENYSGAKSQDLPIVMRGFVSSVSRSSQMGEDGEPHRSIRVAGHDYGKILQVLRIRYLANSVVGDNLMTAFKLFQKFGADTKMMAAGDFLNEIVTKVVNPYLGSLVATTEPNGLMTPIGAFTVESSVAGTVPPKGVQAFEGGVGDLMRTYLDVGAFNELFIEDRPTGVALVARPTPLEDVAGNLIQAGPAAAEATIAHDSVQEFDVTRADSGVANNFWVTNTPWMMETDIYARLVAQGSDDATYMLTDYQNCDPKVYGVRTMEVSVTMGDPAETMGDAERAEAVRQSQTKGMNWMAHRRAALREMNRDNVVFESGSLSVRGDESIKAGMYLNVVAKAYTSRYYVIEVTHQFVPMHGFFTRLQVERGNGFIQRAHRPTAQSTYLAEIGTGV